MLGLTPVRTVVNETMEIRVNSRHQDVYSALVADKIQASWNGNHVTINYNDYDRFMQIIRGLR